ncbi:MAG: DNA polymerase IV [Candidatus Omnitrophica bacterium]|nr:DNA polymerase IV [Candidatus Omnitrophota bacterium]
MNQRYIIHVDMDAFFAAIEQRDNAAFRNRPVIIGADPKKGNGRGVVATCSYQARAFGVHSAMPISQAYRLCPKAVFLPVNMEKYIEVSRQIHDIFYFFTPLVESLSIDEAFLDITSSFHIHDSPLNLAKTLKNRIRQDLLLTASLGLASSKMVAKIASDLNKPDGLVVVDPLANEEFLRPLSVNKVWGIGKKTGENLAVYGIKTIGDIVKADKSLLKNIFGNKALDLIALARGEDFSSVEPNQKIKSISNETTFSCDTSDQEKIKRELMFLSEKVSKRARNLNLKAKTVSVKIRIYPFETAIRSKTLTYFTNFSDDIFQVVYSLFNLFFKPGNLVRLLGVKICGFQDETGQITLFDEKISTKKERIHKLIDSIDSRFGDRTIHRAGSF